MRSLRHSLRVVGLVVLAVAATGGEAAGRGDRAAPVAALVERRAPAESTAPARGAARVAARRVRPVRPPIDRPARTLDRAPRSPVVRRAVPPRRAKSPTYIVHRALLR